MTKTVTFGTEVSTRQKTFPVGVLLKSEPPQRDSQLNQITSVYNGGTKINPTNLALIYKEVAETLKNATFAPINADSLETQDFSYPTCLEAYTVLHGLLRQGESPIGVNELLGYAKRDLCEFRKSSDVLMLRVLIQILKCVDIVFYTDTKQMATPSLAKFFLEQALEGITRSSTSKAMLCICLHIFNHIHMPKLLDRQLSLRLLQAMQSRISTSSVRKSSSALSGEYLGTFKTLFKYQKSLMLEKTALWVPILMNTLVDFSSFIRQQGLAFLQELAKLNSHQISAEIFAVLNSTVAPDTSFTSMAVERMIYFQTLAGDAKATSSIWSCLLVMLDANPAIKVDSWNSLGEWLEVPRMGFGSASLSTKDATYNGWEKVIYLFAFRYEHNTSISRNLASLIHPIKPKRQTSLAVFERFKGCFNILLFIALRCCEQNSKHLGVVFGSLVRPCVEAMLDHPLEPVKTFAIQTLLSLLSLSPGTAKAQRNRVLEEKPVTASEIGGLPRGWIRENTEQFTQLLPLIYKEAGFEQLIKFWDSLVAIIRQGASADSDNFYQQLLNCVEFLGSSKLDLPEELSSQLFTTFVCSFNYSVLVAERYEHEGEKIKVGAGKVSCATMLLSQAISLPDRLFDQMLSRFSTFPSRQVALVAKTCMSNPSDRKLWDQCHAHILRLVSNVNALEADDAAEILRLLESTPDTEDLPSYWIKYFTLCYNKTDDPEFFYDFVERQLAGQRLELFYSFKRTVFIDETLFDKMIVEACARHKPELLEDTNGMDASFQVQVGRHFYSAGQMRKGARIMGSRLKANANLVLATIEDPATREIGLELWEQVCALEGSFMPAAVAKARELCEQGLLQLPAEIEPLSPHKRGGQLSPPPTSPTLSPKRQRLEWSLGAEDDSLDLMSSPPKGHPLFAALDPSALGVSFDRMPKNQLLELKHRLQQAVDLASKALDT